MIWLLGILAAIALAAVASGGDDPEPDDGDYMPGDFLPPLYVSKRGDPELEALLTELDDYLRAEGVDDTLSAAEVTKMHKTSGPSYAIPDRKYWPNMARTGREIWNPFRRHRGRPATVYNGYRPTDYNAAVGGASGSRHQDFAALDVSADKRDKLFLGGIYAARARELDMGYGAYKGPRAHFDAGDGSHPRRPTTWESGSYWVERARRVA